MAFDRQLVDHIPRLRRYARALTGNKDRADDLVQDTLERAWRKQALWQRGSDLRAWLFTVMHNLYANQRRSDSAATLLTFDAHDLPAPGALDQDSTELQDILRGIAQLPVEMREVVLLIGLEQFSYADTAKVLDIPVGTVMSRLSRARERLRLWMSGQTNSANLKVVR